MKKILLFISILLFSGCMAIPQATPLKPGEDEIKKVVIINNTSSYALYHKAKMWIVDKFNSAKDVIEYENPQQGIIIGKGNINYPCSDENDSALDAAFKCTALEGWKIKFTFKIEVKNSKVRITIYNIRTYWPAKASSYGISKEREVPVRSLESMNHLKPSLLNIIQSFKNYMQNLTTNTSNSNW